MNDQTPKTTYTETLKAAGLTPEQALIYEYLLVNGQSPAGKLALKTPLKRGLIYKVLEQLSDLGLVTKHDKPGKVAQFEPAHPNKLQELAEAKEKAAKAAQSALAGTLPDLTSAFNLATGKPGVRFYDGIQGVREAGYDSLKAQGEILTYIDNEKVNKLYPDLNKEYVQIRKRLKIPKKMITIDSEFIRAHGPKIVSTDTQIRLIKNLEGFSTVMQVYNNTVSYISLTPNGIVSMLIENETLAKMHKTLFYALWEHAIPLTNGKPATQTSGETV
jgi:sugar-specific transcriptional regulator TrmB